jgi:AmmeMemoRadiSam system protein A
MTSETKKGTGTEALVILGLARRSVEGFARTGKLIDPPSDLPPLLAAPGAAFVSIHTRAGELRGCIGTTSPTRPTLAEEIIRCGVQAASRDPRFPPVRPEELPALVYKVDILSEPEPVAGPDDLDPVRYGVIVRQGAYSGLLLPDLPQVRTVEEQIWIACLKAGIDPTSEIQILRFTVDRFEE